MQLGKVMPRITSKYMTRVTSYKLRWRMLDNQVGGIVVWF